VGNGKGRIVEDSDDHHGHKVDPDRLEEAEKRKKDTGEAYSAREWRQDETGTASSILDLEKGKGSSTLSKIAAETS